MTNVHLGFGVFISHSGKDSILLNRTKQIIEMIGGIPYVSSLGEHPGTDVDPTARKMIEMSNGVVVLLTEEGCKSQSVNQEIGYIKGKKPILPVLLKGQKMPGIFLHGTEPLPIENDGWESVVKIGKEIVRQEWNPQNKIIDDLGEIIKAKERGNDPFRCHKGHWPGGACNEPCNLYREGRQMVLRHDGHEWESVYVSESMARFLKKYVFLAEKEQKKFLQYLREKL